MQAEITKSKVYEYSTHHQVSSGQELTASLLKVERQIDQQRNQAPRIQKFKQQLKEQQNEKSNDTMIYLRPSKTIKTGIFKHEFDLRFDQLRDTMINKGLWTVLTTFYPEVRKYAQEHPDQIKQPGKEHQQILQRELKMVKPNFSIATKQDIRYTWIGHSTAVIQVGPDNFIIDPVFSDRASPVQIVGPKRFRPPACSIPELPKINAVLISHDHYDHLDQCALSQLQKCFAPFFIAGIGTEDVLPKKCNAILMDWMDSPTINIENRKYKIHFVPVCHWSKRGLTDLNTRLWGGFVIETPFGQKIFYSGDTGYCDVFKEIGKKFGPFDLTILPIGAYEPRHILKPQHVNPQQAVIIHKQLRSRQSVGVHWGTFPLGAQGFYQAKIDLAKARKQHNLDDNEFITVYHGESIVLSREKGLIRELE